MPLLNELFSELCALYVMSAQINNYCDDTIFASLTVAYQVCMINCIKIYDFQ